MSEQLNEIETGEIPLPDLSLDPEPVHHVIGRSFTKGNRSIISVSFDNGTIDAMNQKVGNRKGSRSQYIESLLRQDLGLAPLNNNH